jgi:hypothetical protein
MAEEARYQMLWDCQACFTAGLLALDHKFCPACGAPQDPSARYFPSDDQKVLVEDHAFHGADKVCPACDTPNGALSGFCQACGSPLDDAKEAARRGDRVVGATQVDSGESVKDALDEARQRQVDEEARRRREMAGLPPERPPKKKRGVVGWLLLGCGGVAILALFGCVGFWLLSWMLASSGQVTASGHTWVRSIDVEAFGPVSKSDWQERVPRGASDVRCSREVKDTEKVPDGEDCKTRKIDKGDGTFTEKRECTTRYRTEKIYGEKCRYTVDEWSKSRSERAAGEDLSPRWPAVSLAPGREREGRRSETYTVTFVDERGSEHPCTFDEARWRAIADGRIFEASFGGLTGALDCGSLQE